MNARRPLYDEVADVTFDTSRGPLAEVVEAIVAWLTSEEARTQEIRTEQK
jgi:shikimate kinase